MSLPIVLRDEAQTEFDNAFDYYEAQQAGLGVDFVARVQEVFNRIGANPFIYRAVRGDIRKGLVRRFPYCVIYRPHTDRVEVIAIFHTSRNPNIWEQRADSE